MVKHHFDTHISFANYLWKIEAVGSYASLSVCLSIRLWLDKKYWTIIHNLKSIAPRVTKFGQDMGVGDPEVDLEGQGHRSKVKVTRSKNVILGVIWQVLQVIF